MARALELAREHRTHPNPRVGCVVVANDVIVGEGAHEGPGRPHAEIVAIDQAGSVRGATLYVTLEPCTHHGRTPPCVDRLIAEGVARVVVGHTDPDARVAGAGIQTLRDAGIQVEVLESGEARAVDPAYFHHRQTGMPLVTMKWAMTLDGSVGARDGTSRWISSESSRSDAHRLRAGADAVVVGAGTLRIDDPQLDVRLDGFEGRQPRPVVVAGRGDLPAGARIWQRAPLVFASDHRRVPSGEVVVVPADEGLPNPLDVCKQLALFGLLDVLMEGGPTLAGAWWRSGVVQRGVVYVAAKMGGGQGQPPLAGVFENIDDTEDVGMRTTALDEGDLRIDFWRQK